MPQNAAFLMGAELSALVNKCSDKVKDLKTLFGFRLLLRRHAAEYNKVIGEEVETNKLKEILWNCMDGGSKLEATRMSVTKGNFKLLTDHIDERYKITYGHVEFQGAKDDPMGLFSFLESESGQEASQPADEGRQAETHEGNDLDAFGKGKGKGWQANGGKCNVCGGEGHFA